MASVTHIDLSPEQSVTGWAAVRMALARGRFFTTVHLTELRHSHGVPLSRESLEMDMPTERHIRLGRFWNRHHDQILGWRPTQVASDNVPARHVRQNHWEHLWHHVRG